MTASAIAKQAPPGGLKIGELARAAAVHVETVRYYERRGLLAEPSRTRSGYRIYDPQTVGRLRFIKSAQVLGFSLAEVAELLDLRVAPGTTCQQVRHQAEAKREDVEARIARLQRLRRTLKKLIDDCQGDGPASECPILDAIGEAP